MDSYQFDTLIQKLDALIILLGELKTVEDIDDKDSEFKKDG